MILEKNYPKSMKFIYTDLLRVSKLSTNAKFQHSISKVMPGRPKQPPGHGFEYHYNNLPVFSVSKVKVRLTHF